MQLWHEQVVIGGRKGEWHRRRRRWRKREGGFWLRCIWWRPVAERLRWWGPEKAANKEASPAAGAVERVEVGKWVAAGQVAAVVMPAVARVAAATAAVERAVVEKVAVEKAAATGEGAKAVAGRVAG